jgi:hypothetical protein
VRIFNSLPRKIFILWDWVYIPQLIIIISSVKKHLHSPLDHNPYQCTITFVSEGKGREGKGREGKGREGKGREGKGREGKGREGK